MKNTVVSRGIVVLLAIPFIVSAFYSFSFWRTAVPYQGEIDYTEGTVLSEINNNIHTGNLYHQTEGSFLSATYGPLFYELYTSAAKTNENSYKPLRRLTFLIILGLCFSSAILVRRLTLSRWGYIAGFMAPLLGNYAPFFLIQIRPDTFALFLSIVGFTIVQRKNTLSFILAGVCFGLVAFVKLTYVSAPLAVIVLQGFDYWKLRERRIVWRTISLCLSSAFVIGLLVIVFGHSLGLKELYRHMIIYQSSLTVAWQDAFLYQPKAFISRHIFLLIPCVLLIIRFRQKELGIYFLISCLIHIPAMAKPGAITNYYLEPILLTFLILGSSFILVWKNSKIDFLSFIALIVVVGFYKPLDSREEIVYGFTLQDRTLVETLKKEIPPNSYVLAAFPGPVSRIPNLRLAITCPFQYTQLTKAGIVDGKLMVDSISKKDYDAIVMNYNPVTLIDVKKSGTDRIPLSAARLIAENYKVVKKVDGTFFTEDQYYILKRK